MAAIKFNRRRATSEFYNILAILVLLLFALPAIWIIFTAFRPGNEVNVTPPIWIPRRLTLDAFASLFGFNPGVAAGIPVFDYMRNSIIVATTATLFSVSLGTMAGYAFSRFKFKGHTQIFLLIMLSRSVPGVALGLPLFLLMRNYGLIDTVQGLALVYVAINIPFTAWLMDGFFRQIPKELDEAAYIDGCGHWAAFWRIDLPLALPGMSACRRTVADSVEVAVHVHPGGVITLAGPGPDNKGDAAVARCVAAAFKTSATGWKPGETGIITLQADLDAK